MTTKKFKSKKSKLKKSKLANKIFFALLYTNFNKFTELFY